jgi:hypothetical protein
MPDTKRIIIINLSLSGRIGSIFMPSSFFFYGQQIIIISSFAMMGDSDMMIIEGDTVMKAEVLYGAGCHLVT